MTAVPPRPTVSDLPYPLGRHCCGAPNPSVCHQRGLCWMEGVHPDSPGYTLATPDASDDRIAVGHDQSGRPYAVRLPAPDATAGDGLRSDEWWTRLFLAVEELVSSVPYTDGSKWPVPHAAAFRAAVEPALRDVLAAAARDAEKVRRVESLASGWADLCPPDDWPSSGGMDDAIVADCGRAVLRALDGPS